MIIRSMVESTTLVDVRKDALLIHHIFTPQSPRCNKWLQCNIFDTTCTIGGRQCIIIIGSGSIANVKLKTKRLTQLHSLA